MVGSRRTPEGLVSRRSERLYVSLLLILAGVFYIATMGSGHDWGDDFAQYILHAKNIVLGKPYDQTGYIYCLHGPDVGPKAYPPGFPALLSLVYRTFGLSFVAFKIEEIMFLLLSLAVLWFVSQEYLSAGYRIAFLALLAFSPWLILFKENILSDIPFLFCIYLIFALVTRLYRRGDLGLGWGILLTFLILIASLVRIQGALLIPALLAYDAYEKKRLSRFSVLVALSSIALLLVDWISFPGGLTYMDTMRHWNPRVVMDNLIGCTKSLSRFWPPMIFSPHSTVPLFVLATLFASRGLVQRSRHLTMIEFFSILYLASIVIWPAWQGTRFLIPFIPLYLIYVLVGVDDISRLARKTVVRVALLGALCTAVLASYGLGLQTAVKQLDGMPDGPFTGQATELFSYVRDHTEPNAVFVFRKPRALALFTNRSATMYSSQGDSADLAYFSDVQATHVIVDLKDAGDKTRLAPLLDRNPAMFHKVFENTRFAVFTFCSRC